MMAKKDAVEKKNTKTNAEDGKSEALKLAMAQITKQFGDGSIMKLGEAPKMDVELLPSGSLSLDLALGGGWPKGRIIEIYGPESSGKTTLARILAREFKADFVEISAVTAGKKDVEEVVKRAKLNWNLNYL